MMDRAQYFKSLEDRYGLPDGYLEKTMMIESRGDIRAYNKDSKAAGPFQFVPDTQKEFNLKNPYSLEESADAAARVAVRNKTSLQRNGIENPSGADLYAAHQQGARGYVDLLRGGDQLAVKVRGEKPVLLNGGKPDMTASEFANRIRTKFSGDDSSPLPKAAEQTATGVFAKPNVDVAENPDQAAALEGQAPLSTQDVLDTSNAAAGRSGSGLKELGFLHNYFKSLDTSATGVKPLSVPNFFNQPRYKHGGIVSLKEDAKRVRAAGIGGDTVLAHITPSEAALLKSMGGSGRINPRTGLPMFEMNDSSDSKSDASDAPGTNSNASSGQEQGPGLGLNDSFGMEPGEYGPSMGSMNFGGPTVSDALGNTSLGSFGFDGITSNSLDVTSPFSGTPTAPEAVPGYEGPGKSVTDSVFSGSTPTVDPANPPSVLDTQNDKTTSFTNAPDKAPGFDVTNALSLANVRDAISKNIDALVEAPATVGKSPSQAQAIQDAKDRATTVDRTVGFTPEGEKAKQEAISLQALEQMNLAEIGKQAAFSAVTSTPTTTTAEEVEAASSKAAQNAREQAVANALSGLVEAPSAIGVTPSTSVAPSTSTPSQSTPSSTNPTASSSTSKGKGYDITGFDFIDSKLSSMINNPTATIAGLAVSAVNPVAGFANAVTGNQIGLAVDRAISSITGTQPGPGNTVTSEEPGTNPASPSTPSGPGPSVGDMTFGGNYSGDSTTHNPVTPATSTSGTTATPINYDVSKFLGALGKSSYTTPASVYTSYPVQQGIGSIAAPQYTGSFYNPSFGKVPYQ